MSVSALAGMFCDICGVYPRLKLSARLDRIPSATSYSDLHFLYMLARYGRGSGRVVEIGAYKGKSTCVLAMAGRPRGEKVISIDPHIEGTEKEYRANLERFGVAGQVVPLTMYSEDGRAEFGRICAREGWAPECVRFIFIDGSHEYEFVRKDILLWKDTVIDGGVIAFHDFTWEGVRRALDELIRTDPAFTIEGTVGMTLYVSKGWNSNRYLFEKMRAFDSLKRVVFRRGARRYGTS